MRFNMQLTQEKEDMKTTMKSKGRILTGMALAACSVLLGLVGCSPAGSNNDVISVSGREISYRVVVIDDCEYIYLSRRPWGAEMSLAHKGNCTNCANKIHVHVKP